jgi:zinc transport system permease protein
MDSPAHGGHGRPVRPAASTLSPVDRSSASWWPGPWSRIRPCCSFDEPTSNIDPQGKICLFDLLSALSSSITIVMVSHDLISASTRISSVAVVNRTLIQSGSRELTPAMLELIYGTHDASCPLDEYIRGHVLHLRRRADHGARHERPAGHGIHAATRCWPGCWPAWLAASSDRWWSSTGRSSWLAAWRTRPTAEWVWPSILGLPVLPCAVGFTVLAALIMALASFGRTERADGIIGIMWAAGMAFGIILMDLTPGYNVDLMSYLFGSLLAVPASDIWFMLLLDLIILGVVLFWYKDFLSLSFDAEFARSMGVPVRLLYALMQVLTAVTVVMVIQVAGLILVIALLTIPPMLSELFTNSLWKMMALATLASLAFCLAGLALSYHFDITSGASIIAVATSGYALAWVLQSLRGRR